jgi:hypothetical protein
MNAVGPLKYRVIKLTSIGAGDNAKHTREIIWQGSDIDELSRSYPPSQIFGADPLGYSEIEGGHIRFTYHFERYMPEGEGWFAVEDPRRRITPTTQLEREIDAENRRLYPGDYEQEDPYEDYEDYDYQPPLDFEPEDLEVEPEPCDKCGMNPCFCDMIAMYEAERGTCPNCGGSPEVHNERACQECGDCLCGGECGYDYEADRCYFCNRVGCEGGCYEERYTLRVQWTTSRLRHLWRAYYWLQSALNRRAV